MTGDAWIRPGHLREGGDATTARRPRPLVRGAKHRRRQSPDDARGFQKRRRKRAKGTPHFVATTGLPKLFRGFKGRSWDAR